MGHARSNAHRNTLKHRQMTRGVNVVKTNVIPFRLRKILDDDLRDALEQLPPGTDRSEVIREALRAHLFPQKETQVHTEPEKKKTVIELKPVKVTWLN